MANLLMNPGFNEQQKPPTMLTGGSHGGWSAAPKWTTWNNSDAVTTTDVLPSTRKGGVTMLHVCTTGPGNGIVQTYGQQDPSKAHEHVRSEVWVFVLRGTVGIGTGDGGNTHIDVQSTTQGQWERLVAVNGVSPANEFIVYATSPDGACFYVEDGLIQTRPG